MSQLQQRTGEQASRTRLPDLPAGQVDSQRSKEATTLASSRNPHRIPAPSSSSLPGNNSSLTNTNGIVSEVQSHSFPKPPGGAKFSSRSLFYEEAPRSPRDKLDELLATESSHYAPPKPANRQYSDSQVAPKPQQPLTTRNVSSPTLPLRAAVAASPEPNMTSINNRAAPSPLGDRKDSLDSPRSLSSQNSHGRRSSQDNVHVDPSEVSNLISSSGSPEAAITRLIKEKTSMSTQNSQLWRLVEKQRAMILGLNKDMDRVLKDKEKYKKKLKEHMAQVTPALEVHKRPSEKDDAKSSMQEMVSNSLRDSATLPAEEPLKQRQMPSEPSFDGFDDDGHAKAGSRAAQVASLSNINTTGMVSSSVPSPLGSASSPRGFAASRAQPAKHRKKPSIGIDTAAGKSDNTDRNGIITPSRKPPPAPLVLPPSATASAPPTNLGPDDHSESEYEEDERSQRGRRKTREDDDKARDVVAAQEEEHRSQSKKSKQSKSAAPPDEKLPQKAAPKRAVPVAPPSNLAQLVQGDSMASVLNNAPLKTHTNNQRFVSLPMPSPGLPTSPRPQDRPLNSPAPRMPRQGANLLQSPPLSSTAPGFNGLPLSPRAPRQPFPLPPNTPMSMVSPGLQRPGAAFQISSPLAKSFQRTAPDVTNVLATKYRAIYRGLVSDQHPSLLLPPNALPLIVIKVSSSRMKPSRASFIAGKSARVSEDENVFTLGVFARSDGQELWRVEKEAIALPHLDHKLKQNTELSAKIPDRSLFSGHAPAKIDARRAAIDQYFEAVLDTELDDKTALELCQFLSTDAIEPAGEVETVTGTIPENTSTAPAINRNKKGYLTKRGKNFGGWKARYFVLDGSSLRYYEAPGGAHLGTIKLMNAQIEKHDSSTSRHDTEDDEYRHAFEILEPKKKDSSSLLQHVLCAESDAERDEWVKSLQNYVDSEPSDEEDKGDTTPRDAGKSSGFHSMKMFVTGRKEHRDGDSPSAASHHDADSLRGFSYEKASQAEPPANLVRSTKTDESPSPPLISRPTNGAKIQDAEAWGNKSTPHKEHKKRNIFGFRGRSSSDLQVNTHPAPPSSNEPVRPCFGVPLAEAAEFCRPVGVDVYLPAVVYRCIDYLEANDAALEEGIFRLSGSNTVIKSLRERFNTEGDVNIIAEDQYFDVHAVASLLKLYLRELPVTILTRELHLDFLRVLDLDKKSQKTLALNHLVHQLPRANWFLLRALSAFLLTIITASDTNKMTVRNVGIVFSPTLNIPAPVFSLFLTDFDAIFTEEAPDTDSVPSPIATASPTTPLTPEDIRSPRKQMFTELSTPSFNQTSFPGLPTSPRHAPTLNAPEPRSPNSLTGFHSMQRPAGFANPYAQQRAPPQQQAPVQMVTQVSTGQEFGSLNSALAPAPQQTQKQQEQPKKTNKAQRRESAMLGMGMGVGYGSLPQKQETIVEDA